MGIEVWILLISFCALLLLNTPIAVAVGLSSFLAMLSRGTQADYALAQRMTSALDSFALLAIPFFVFSGMLMGRGGMARRLMNLAQALVGHFPGGLGYVNTLTCMLFGSISGSAAAAVSSVGGFMIPEMVDKKYDRGFSVAITTTAATTGLLIPPSNIMIIYAITAGSVSIASMFLAGVFPGIVMGLCLMVAAGIISKKQGYGKERRVSLGELLVALKESVLSLLLVVIVIGGILGGVFTATEAAAIAVAYSFFLAVVLYREVKLREMPDILLQSGKTTAIVMLLIAASCAMSYFLTVQQVPQTVSRILLNLSDSPIVILLLINFLLLLVGTFMDMTPAILIFTPIFLPVVSDLGVHPVHFGIMMIANLCIGLCTPPVGSCLFIGCSVGKYSISKILKPMIPFFIAMLVAQLLIVLIPDLSLYLPEFLGVHKGQ